MKKTLILCLFSLSFIYGHEQHVHQYFTKEAYYLLRDYLNSDIPVMLNHLDSGPVGPAWTNGTILAGAWREDEEDIVYGLYQFMPGDPVGALTSITHFWDADNGDFTENTFQVAWSFFTGSIGPYPNSYSKINKFAFGGYILYFNVLPYLRVQKSNGEWLRLIPGTPYNTALSYYSLKDLYLNRRLVTQLVGSYKMYNENKSTYEYYYGDVYVSEDFRDKLVWEILGRMCHLLQDLSIPAHTHRDEHGLPPSDQYEDWVAYNGRYNYYSHLNIGTGILDPYISSNPLHYLMYTTQQIGDHFGSSGPYEGVGNDVLGGDASPEELSFFNTIPLTSLGSPTYLSGSYSDLELNNIRDKTIPHVLKATAGLLYWFAMETDLLPNTLFINSFNGGNILINSTNLSSGHRLLSWNNPSSVTLQASDQEYGDCYWRFQNWQRIVSGDVVQTYNTRNITITPTANTTYKANFTSENYFGFRVTGPTKGLYRNESHTYNIYSFYGNPTANYYWRTEYRNIQNGQVYWSPGLPEGCSISFSSSGNSATFSNYYFSKYCGGWADSVIRVHGTVQPAACGCQNQYFFEEITLKNRQRPGYPPPPPPGGCPYVYIWNGNEWIEDNNILPQSQDPSLLGQNVTDYYQLFNKPVEEDGKYYLAISEYEEDRSFFDQLKLLVIDHPQETFITVDDSGTVIQFAKPAFFANAELDSNDVYKQLYSLDDIKTEVSSTDTLSLSFEDVNSGTEQWLLLVGQVQALAKEKVSGKIIKTGMSGKENSASFTSFRLRKNPTYQWIVAPASNTSTLQIDIAWQEKAEIDYTELSNKVEIPFTLHEAELVNAVHSVTGDIINDLVENDGTTVELNKNDWIELAYSIPQLTFGMQRSFVFVSKGRYERLSNKSLNLSGKNQLLKNGSDLSLPLEYSLSQNYPNPFNPSAIINYSIKDAGNVRLNVYDILGNEVGELVNRNLNAGHYSVEFNASNLPSGVYIYTIQVNNFFDSKKMILIK